MQNPTTDVPPPTTAAKIQNNDTVNQNTSLQADANPILKPKFACKDCNFTCSSFQNFRIHLQTVHQMAHASSQKMSTLKKPVYVKEKPKGKAAPNIQPAADFDAVRFRQSQKWIPQEEIGKYKETMHVDSERNIAKLKDYISRADREPLIGLEYVLEYRFKSKGNQIEIRYFCELCECDTDRDPMVEHLAGFGHRKLYLAKEYPYVLKAQSNSKEDQSRFIRRMALEIEREEGTKMYMIDPSFWMETMMTLRTADKKMKKRTRWDDDKNVDQTRMQKALNFLGTFEIESEIEATTVTRLCEKLTTNLKFYNNKAKADALFPARVARAQDVAMSLIKNAARQRTNLQNPVQKKGKQKMAPQLNRPPNLPQNVNFKNKAEMQSGFPGPNFQKMNAKQNFPMAPPYQQAQKYPFVPLKQARQVPSMPQMNKNPQKAEKSGESLLKNVTQEDTQFFKKLMALLEALPQSASPPDSTQMDSKLLMLKSMLVNQKSADHEQANQKLMTQIASMVQDTISAQNANLNQQLMMLMTSQNSTSMVMQTASLRNNLMTTDGFVPGMQSSGTMQTNLSSLVPFSQRFGSQTYGQMGGNAFSPMDPNAHQDPQVAMQSYPGTSQRYPGTAQNYDHFGYGNPVVDNYLPQGNPYVQHDGISSLTTGQNAEKFIPYTDVGYEPNYYDNPSRQVPEPRYVDRSEEEVAYTRVCLSPSSRPSLRSYNSSDWDDRKGDMPYIKRPRLDMDRRSDRSENYHNQSLESLGINTAGMPKALIKRIQGKDLFTASAIIDEYSERHSGI